MANMVQYNSRKEVQNRERFYNNQSKRNNNLLYAQAKSDKKKKNCGSVRNARDYEVAEKKNTAARTERIISVFSIASFMQSILVKAESGITNMPLFVLLACAGVIVWGFYYEISNYQISRAMKEEEIEELGEENLSGYQMITRKVFKIQSAVSAILFMILLIVFA